METFVAISAGVRIRCVLSLGCVAEVQAARPKRN